jgi:hypothetical protein
MTLGVDGPLNNQQPNKSNLGLGCVATLCAQLISMSLNLLLTAFSSVAFILLRQYPDPHSPELAPQE